MESESMELKLMSCKDVSGFNFFQKLSVYALVSLVSHDPNKKLEPNQQQRTPTVREGDGDPEWNHEMRFDLHQVSVEDCDHAFIHFDLRHQGVMFGDKDIGEVHVPLKDLVEESNGVVRFVNYQVRNCEGKPNGVLSFSYKVNGKGKNNGTSCGSNITGFPIIHDHHQQYSHENEIHYPTLEEVHYPSLDLLNSSEEPLFAPQEDHSYAPQAYYPPPDAYYAPPPPPPPPPRPPMLHGPPFYPDPYKVGGGYGYYGPHASFWNGR